MANPNVCGLRRAAREESPRPVTVFNNRVNRLSVPEEEEGEVRGGAWEEDEEEEEPPDEEEDCGEL